MKIFFVLLVAQLSAACAPNYMVLVKNPQTGDVRECKRNPLKNWTWEEHRVVDECVAEYQKSGYERVK
jgi:hypothetical protein